MTGSGRAFCAGADMDMLAERRARRTAGDPEPVGHGGTPAGIDWVELCLRAVPLVAAVNGVAVGVGLTMILPFDVIVASDAARFGIGLTKVGLLPELASSHLLVQRMGLGGASRFCLTGDLWSAEEADRGGLADLVVPADDLLDAAVALAARIAANPRPQLRLLKQLLTLNGSETDLEVVQTREDRWNRTYAVPSPEHQEAVAAFAEKRAPHFTPRPPDDVTDPR
jgi:enoyl-CoA hydratase/carnithine racemase